MFKHHYCYTRKRWFIFFLTCIIASVKDMKLEMREIYCEIWKKQTIKQELCKNTLTKKN